MRGQIGNNMTLESFQTLTRTVLNYQMTDEGASFIKSHKVGSPATLKENGMVQL